LLCRGAVSKEAVSREAVSDQPEKKRRYPSLWLIAIS
jgi:hypothetical protein